MQAIRYKVHFLTLIPAAIAFCLIMKLGDAIRPPYGFFLIFGAMGVLHAASLVISLSDRSAVTFTKTVTFMTVVGVLSILTVFSPFLLLPILSVEKTPHLNESVRIFLVLAGGSAFGASAYWLLLRLIWLKSRRFVNLITTIALCSATTVVSWLGAGTMTVRARDIAELVPTFGWWVGFSFSLFIGDLRWSAENVHIDAS